MKEITRQMFYDFKMDELGYDWMGYEFCNPNCLSFHHLIVPNRLGGAMSYENGSILCGNTSHPYLHLIEAKEYELFMYITSEIIDMKNKGYIDKRNLKNINEILEYFEYKHIEDKGKKGKYLIKEEYLNRRKF